MFLLFPIGHDRSVFGVPWLTLTMIAACTIVFGATWAIEADAMENAVGAEQRVIQVLTEHPEACVDFALSGLPDEILAMLQAPRCDPSHPMTEADLDLVRASHALIAEVNRIPTLRMGYRPGRPSVGTLFSSMWLHGGFFHLFGNMVFLLLAGSVIESFWGPVRFFVLYIASGIAGTLLHHAMNVGGLTPMVGASGAISGLLGAFVVLYPRTRIQMAYLVWLLVYFRRGAFFMPAWAAIPLWAAQQFLGAAFDVEGGVAYGAHIGGLCLGVLAGVLALTTGIGAVPEREIVGPPIGGSPPGVGPSVPPPPGSDLPALELGPLVRSSRPRPSPYPDGIPLDLDEPDADSPDPSSA